MPTSKQIRNRDKFTKEYKVKEIQRNLTKKARLRKEYLKALKSEGYEVPDKKPTPVSKDDIKHLKEERALQGKRKLDEKKEIKKQRKRLQAEHAQEAKRKEEERIKIIEQKAQEREKRKVKMTQKTKTGQPKMGPKIDDMLDKIKNNSLYTE
ncbi:ZYRO0F02618p [Zygosaccharomyces rouxii]|uniref:rRNA-processing protein FYV7 n=1 Tax=Zygosaccharomyces rouxii (strain ATCC 2623 / CBS 732 / NBRC 1130 / NCYC 568 / NRRL Y-229) TaxID=559307 RepID=C5DX67_ZYGRC|nr:uncharacterized protein ZYRO0F02618g [Zygosaccharomyces rouxii]KAH9199141.1 Fyv7/TAP26 [Zygosaccharomyces rouxii]CAR28378.1 ZYRO0F02618p [Zygosaccharomyces rouxii]